MDSGLRRNDKQLFSRQITIQNESNEMTGTDQPPEIVAQLSGKACATFCGMTSGTASRIYGWLAVTGHGCMGLSGKFTGNPWEMTTGVAWTAGSLAMALCPMKRWTLGFMGATVILGATTLGIGAVLHKEHYTGQLIFCSLAVARSALLLCDKNRFFPHSPVWQSVCENKKEINGSIALPSRLGLLIDGALNGQVLIGVAAVLYQVCDFCLFASGRADKRTTMQLQNAGASR